MLTEDRPKTELSKLADDKFAGLRTHMWTYSDMHGAWPMNKKQRDSMLRRHYGWDEQRPIVEMRSGANCLMAIQAHDGDYHLPSYKTFRHTHTTIPEGRMF